MITLGFSTDQSSLISKVIRWFTGSKYSHAFIVITEDPILGSYVLQSDTGGVEITSFKRFNFTKNPILKTVAPKMDLTAAVKSCLNLLNDKYDFLGLLGMSWVELQWHVFKHKVKNPLHEKNAFFCSAFVTKVLQAAKWPNADTLIPQDTDAQMLADFLDKNPA